MKVEQKEMETENMDKEIHKKQERGNKREM